VVVAHHGAPLSAISLSEVLATSDVPGGVVNILTGSPAEIAPWLASHADVNGLDLAGAEQLEWVDLQIAAADTLKRVSGPVVGVPAPSIERVVQWTETKTVWHTKSLI
jgi:acyl-CoA reductase-like NAD-dependent aldehyde dehydrogenase